MCQVTNSTRDNPKQHKHILNEKEVTHNTVAMDLLHKLVLVQPGVMKESWFGTNKRLKVEIHYLPAALYDNIFSPCDGRLFTTTRNHQNLKLVTVYLASQYLVKYVAFIDEHNWVYVGNSAGNIRAVKLSQMNLANTKVTTLAINERKAWTKDRRRN